MSPLSHVTEYVWDGQNLVSETEQGTTDTYTYDMTGVHTRKHGNTVTSYLKDYHGNVIGSADSTGRLDYDAYGNQLHGETPDPFGYCGEYYDSETGLIYLRNRYYDPATSRMLSEDPARAGTNWYIYCENNPVKYIDPLGLAPWEHFSTRDEASADFGLYIGQKSIDIEEEFASCIYKGMDENGDAYYFYDDPRNDLNSHEERNVSFSISWDGTYGTPVALTHTHGAYDANTENTKDGFSYAGNVASGNDKLSDAYWSDKNSIDYYVITPNGNMRLYVANSGNYSGELLNSDMLVDSRIQIHKQMQNTLLWGLLQSNFPNGTSQDYVNARRANPNSLLDTINALERFR